MTRQTKWYERIASGSSGLIALGIFALVVAGTLCTLLVLVATRPVSTPTPTDQPTARPTVTSSPTATPARSSPAVRLSPAEGAPGTSITVTGEGWRPADNLFIALSDPAQEPSSQIDYTAVVVAATVNDQGTFAASFTFPNEARWANLPRVRVLVLSQTSGQMASSELNVVAPAPTLTPSPTATPTRPAPTVSPTSTPRPSATPTPAIRGWRGEYFSNPNLIGAPVVVRDDTELNFNWGSSAPAAGLPADDFSVRWTRTLSFSPGNYRFTVHADDGVRVWLDGELILDEWHAASGTTYSADRTLSAAAHSLRIEYFESKGIAQIQFGWELLSNVSEWRGEYFANRSLSGAPTLVRSDSSVDFNWSSGAPAAGLPADNFSARWTRVLFFDEGSYRFHLIVDDGARLYLDGALPLDEWRDGGRREVTVDLTLTSGNHDVRVDYYERAGNAYVKLSIEKLSASYAGWKGEYWSNPTLTSRPTLVRNDVSIDFDWGQGAPAFGLPSDNFSARWTRTVDFAAATYRFHVLVDDGARLWVDDQLIVDEWRDGSAREVMADIALAQGAHHLRLEYYERTDSTRIQLRWEQVAASYPDWKGEYWTNRDLNGAPALTRNDRSIDFDWQHGAPAAGLPADDFSARWSRTATFSAGVFRLYAYADDGVRVTVDGALAIDRWSDNNGSELYTADVYLSGAHALIVEYYEHSGFARVKLWWERIGDLPPAATATPTPAATSATRTPTPTPTPTLTSTPTHQPGLVVQGHVRLNSANGAGLAGVQIYRSFASYPGALVATTNQDGGYETDFQFIPGDEMVTVWAELAGYTFEPKQQNWRHYYGYTVYRVDFIASLITPTGTPATPTAAPAATSTPTSTPTATATPPAAARRSTR